MNARPLIMLFLTSLEGVRRRAVLSKNPHREKEDFSWNRNTGLPVLEAELRTRVTGSCIFFFTKVAKIGYFWKQNWVFLWRTAVHRSWRHGWPSRCWEGRSQLQCSYGDEAEPRINGQRRRPIPECWSLSDTRLRLVGDRHAWTSAAEVHCIEVLQKMRD